MLVNINAASAGRQSALGELGELSRARVILSEFKYNRGGEIYGEAEPADYIYQVPSGWRHLWPRKRFHPSIYHGGNCRHDRAPDEAAQPGARRGNRRGRRA